MDKTFTGANSLRWKGCLPQISRNSTNINSTREKFLWQHLSLETYLDVRTLFPMLDALAFCSWYINYKSLTTYHYPSCTRINQPLKMSIWSEETDLAGCTAPEPRQQDWASPLCRGSVGRLGDRAGCSLPLGVWRYGAAQSAGGFGERHWGETYKKQAWEVPQLPEGHRKSPSFPPYLVGAGNAQLVEDGQEDLCAAQHHQAIGDGEDAEDGTIAVDLSRGAQHGDSWHEAGSERERNREGTHATACHEEVLGCLLAPSREGIVDTNDSWDQQHDCKDHIVPDNEAPHATGGTCPWR